jgi:Amt family ammonium transporter
MMKNLLLTCIAVLMWWFTGYALAFGSPQKFVGNDGWHFASAGFEKMRVDNYLRFVYELAFCIVVCILFTGPLAERTRMVAYACYTFLLAGYIYPVIVAWVWGGGWLA